MWAETGKSDDQLMSVQDEMDRFMFTGLMTQCDVLYHRLLMWIWCLYLFYSSTNTHARAAFSCRLHYLVATASTVSASKAYCSPMLIYKLYIVNCCVYIISGILAQPIGSKSLSSYSYILFIHQQLYSYNYIVTVRTVWALGIYPLLVMW